VAEAKVTLKAGPHEFTLKWLNPPAKIPGNNRTLSGLRLRLLGPSDTRTELHRRLAAVIGNATGEARARLVAQSFVSRAFRRPATPSEINRYVKVFLEGEQAGGKWESGAQAMIAVVLASPKFIFRAEQDDAPTAQDAHPVSEFAPVPPFAAFRMPPNVTAPVVALTGVKPVLPALKLSTPAPREKEAQVEPL
jgi:hypothetical protein